MTATSPTVGVYSSLARQFAEHSADRSHMHRLHQQFGQFLNDGSKVLDIGAGPGHDAAELAGSGFEVIAADASLPLLSFAVAHERIAGRAVAADARKLPFRAKTFHGVWACASLLHVPRDEVGEALAECRRVLMEGGLLFTSMQRGRRALHAVTSDHDSLPGREYWYYSGDEWLTRIERAGLDIIEQRVARSDYVNEGAEGWIETFARKPLAG